MKEIEKGIKQTSNSFSFISGKYKIFQEIEKETLVSISNYVALSDLKYLSAAKFNKVMAPFMNWLRRA